MTDLILIRGLPGSGKSTMARGFVKMGYELCEADDYFYLSGEYIRNKDELPVAHAFCTHKAFTALDQGCQVIVANTFVRLWELMPYVRYAQHTGKSWTIIHCTGQFKNIHGVPDDIMDFMRATWEDHSPLKTERGYTRE